VGKTELPSIRISISLIMLFQVSALIIRELARLEMTGAGQEPAIVQHVSALFGFAALGIFMWPLLRGHWMNVPNLFHQPRSWPQLIMCSVAIGLLFRLANWTKMIASIAFGLQGQADSIRATEPVFWWACPPAPSLLLGIVVMAGLTPLVEEFVHRGLILCSLFKRRRVAAILVSAISFSVLHSFNDILLAFAFGIVAAIQMINYRTLWASLLAHMTFNLMITFDWDCLHGIWIPESASPTLGVISTGLTIAFLVAALAIARKTNAGAP